MRNDYCFALNDTKSPIPNPSPKGKGAVNNNSERHPAKRCPAESVIQKAPSLGGGWGRLL